MNHPILWRRIRQTTQIVFLVIYVILFFTYHPYFFQFDPLHLITVSFSSHQFNFLLIGSTILIIITFFAGRFFCNWLCPLGTGLDLLVIPRFLRRKKNKSIVLPGNSNWKYYILFYCLITAIIGLQLSWVVDPFSLLSRGITVFVYGFKNATAVQLLCLTGLVLILGLNLFRPRYWCSVWCPLGAVYALISPFSRLNLQINDRCIKCTKCVSECPFQAIDSTSGDPPVYRINSKECTLCLNCTAVCPVNAIPYTTQHPEKESVRFSLSRRYLLSSLGSVVVSIPLLKGIKYASTNRFLRPPGVDDEPYFLDKCIRCAECVKVCPTKGLVPYLLSPSIEGFYSPRFVPRVGYCVYNCNACGRVCPTGAIPGLSLPAKKRAVIGLAVFDYPRCIRCLRCEEVCPVPEKAIHVIEDRFPKPTDKKIVSRFAPYTLPELCIGCGACEFNCPVEGESAVRVFII